MLKYNPELCLLCQACNAVCETEAIVVFPNRLELDRDKCTECNACIKVCPTGALS